jgi:hypothetical protein
MKNFIVDGMQFQIEKGLKKALSMWPDFSIKP